MKIAMDVSVLWPAKILHGYILKKAQVILISVTQKELGAGKITKENI